MLSMGMPSLVANATNAAAQWPGSLAGALGFRKLWPQVSAPLKLLGPVALAGGALGGWLLLQTPTKLFDWIVPVLVGGATLLMALPKEIKLSRVPHRVIHLLVSIYGGYFGAGMGILMLAHFRSMLPDNNLHEWNALKSLLAVLINVVAAGLFVLAGKVDTLSCLLVMGGSMAGNWLGAHYSQRLPVALLRKGIIAYGILMTIWLTKRAIGSP